MGMAKNKNKSFKTENNMKKAEENPKIKIKGISEKKGRGQGLK